MKKECYTLLSEVTYQQASIYVKLQKHFIHPNTAVTQTRGHFSKTAKCSLPHCCGVRRQIREISVLQQEYVTPLVTC